MNPSEMLKTAPDLYRAKLSCNCGKSVLAGELTPPHGVSRADWATYHLLSAVEAIALHLLDEKAEACGRKAKKARNHWPKTMGKKVKKSYCHRNEPVYNRGIEADDPPRDQIKETDMQTWNEYISARPDLQTLVDETRALLLGHPDLADYEEAEANIAKLQAAKREWEAAR